MSHLRPNAPNFYWGSAPEPAGKLTAFPDLDVFKHFKAPISKGR